MGFTSVKTGAQPMTSSQSVMLTQAQVYADAGKRVFPVKMKDKQPAFISGFRHGFKDATTSKEAIKKAWATTDFNIGLATGEVNNLVVVDVDDEQIWAKFSAHHGKLPLGPKVTTGKGHHLYFAYPKGRQIRNRQTPGNGFDIRANGGYVVAPPSIHHTGKVYRFTTTGEPPELPAWLLELIAQPEIAANTTLNFNASIPASNDSQGYCTAALNSECQAIATAPEGTRNAALNTASFSIGQLVAGGGIAEHVAREALTQAGNQAGLSANEVAKTINSGIQAGKANPRAAPTRTDGQSLDITKLTEVKPALSALDQLSAYTANGRSAEMRQQMLDDKYVLDRIAILGQWTTLYAAPNGGKTLLTLWMLIQQVKAGEIDGSKIYYVNADDHYKGQVEKLELLEPHKINVLLPGQNGFDTDKLTQLIGQLTKDKQAMGQVIILDTLKKFTDLMDKTASSDFGKLARTFVGAGGTIIALAHTNKNKDDEGKGVAGGTSDIMDDCDCAFLIEGRGPDGHNKYKAIFYNRKARGDVAQKVAFQYSKLDGCTYEQLLSSVAILGKKEAKAEDEAHKLQQAIRDDEETVLAILEALGEKELLTKDILAHVTEETAISHARAKKALLKWKGEDYAQGHRWTVRSGDKSKKHYTRLANPIDAFIDQLVVGKS
jgi:hypothetical protein